MFEFTFIKGDRLHLKLAYSNLEGEGLERANQEIERTRTMFEKLHNSELNEFEKDLIFGFLEEQLHNTLKECFEHKSLLRKVKG